MKLVTRFAAAFALSSVAIGAASAQDVRSASEGVVACQTLTDPTEKLACYEAAAAQVSQALSAPVAAPEVAVVSPPTVVATAEPAVAESSSEAVQTASAEAVDEPGRRRLLPSWVPSISLKLGSDGNREKQPNSFPVSVTRIQRNKVGRHFFTTSDGHVWRQIRVEEITAPPTLPAGAVVKRSMTGAIRIRFDDASKHSYNVIRIE